MRLIRGVVERIRSAYAGTSSGLENYICSAYAYDILVLLRVGGSSMTRQTRTEYMYIRHEPHMADKAKTYPLRGWSRKHTHTQTLVLLRKTSMSSSGVTLRAVLSGLSGIYLAYTWYMH